MYLFLKTDYGDRRRVGEEKEGKEGQKKVGRKEEVKEKWEEGHVQRKKKEGVGKKVRRKQEMKERDKIKMECVGEAV